MKNLFAIGLICFSAAFFAACGSVEGGYEGYADVTGGMYGRGDKILAKVEKTGETRTIDFVESNFIKNCKLKIYPGEETFLGGSGQRCTITAGGETETLKVDSALYFDTSNGGLKAFKVIVNGKASGSGKDVQMIYEGFNAN
jgi:hypothetical protein